MIYADQHNLGRPENSVLKFLQNATVQPAIRMICPLSHHPLCDQLSCSVVLDFREKIITGMLPRSHFFDKKLETLRRAGETSQLLCIRFLQERYEVVSQNILSIIIKIKISLEQLRFAR